MTDAVQHGDKVELRNDPRAAEADATRRAVLEAARRAPAPPLAPLAGATLLLVALVMVTAKWHLVAQTHTGRANGYRDMVCVILLGLAGLAPTLSVGRHLVSSVVAGLAGLGLLANGALAPHDSATLRWTELVLGVVTVVAAAVVALSPRPALDDEQQRDRAGG